MMNRGPQQEAPLKREDLIDFNVTFPIDIEAIQHSLLGNMELCIKLLIKFESVALNTMMRSMAKCTAERDLDGMN